MRNDTFRQMCEEVDILCLNETKCDDVDLEEVSEVFKSYGYVVHMKNRKKLASTRSGGILIAIKNKLMKLCKPKPTKSECILMIKISRSVLGIDKDIILSSVYVPPPGTPYATIEHFNDITNEILNFDYDLYEHLLCGDFNSHTGEKSDLSRIDNHIIEALHLDENIIHSLCSYDALVELGLPTERANCDKSADRGNYGDELLQLCKNNKLCIFNGRCGNDKGIGRATTTANTVVDYVIGTPFLLSRVAKFDILDYDPLFSDMHHQIIFEIKTTNDNVNVHQEADVKEPDVDESKAIGTNVGKWVESKKGDFIDNIDIDKINTLLEKIDSEAVNDVVKDLSSLLINAARVTFPVKNRKKRGNKVEGYDKDCWQARQQYHRAKARHNKKKTDETRENMVNKSKQYKQELNRAKKIERKKFISKLRSLKTKNPKEYWKLLQTKKIDNTPISINELHDYFKQLNAGTDENDDELPNEMTREEHVNLDTNMLDTEFTEDEISKLINNLKNNKSPGIDRLTNEYIKASKHLLLPLYVKLFNKILNTQHIPEDWLGGMIVPIYKKKGDKLDPNNYRGITLLSCLGKVFTAALNARLNQFCEINDVLNENQTGFRSGYSTVDHAFILNCMIEYVLSIKGKLFCAFIDYRKAFDCVWRKGLWYKMNKMGIQGKVFATIKSMYKAVKSCVVSNGKHSDFFMCNSGVRQGENLSPLLFSLYVNDLENYLVQKGCSSASLHSEDFNNYLKLFVLLYADDTLIIANTSSKLQQALNHVEQYCSDWKLDINCSKTKIIVFGEKIRDQSKYNFIYKGNALELVNEFKYLGITFSHNGSFRNCIKDLKQQANRAMYSLLAKCRRHSLPVDIQLQLFHATVLPILTYGCEVWGVENIEECEKLHRKFLKHILGVKMSTCNAMVYGETGQYPIEITIKVRMINYWMKLLSGKSTKLSKIMYDCLLRKMNRTGYESKWVLKVKQILDYCGISEAWLNQELLNNELVIKHVRCTVEQVLKDQYVQRWQAELESHSTCELYKKYKTNFELERYLSLLSYTNRRALTKLRTNNNRLPIITSKYKSNKSVKSKKSKVNDLKISNCENIENDRSEKLCKLCDSQSIGDEFHLIFECSNSHILTFREKYLANMKYYTRLPNRDKLIQMLSSTKNSILVKLSNFLKFALQRL